MRRSLRINLDLAWGYSKHNSHGTQKPGQPWNMKPIKWAFRRWPLDLKPPTTGTRYALYGPSGQWFHFDVVVGKCRL